jgi:hypothetical protein
MKLIIITALLLATACTTNTVNQSEIRKARIQKDKN